MRSWGGGRHGAEKTTKAAGIFWALAAVVATSTCKLTAAMVVRSGTKPSQWRAVFVASGVVSYFLLVFAGSGHWHDLGLDPCADRPG